MSEKNSGLIRISNAVLSFPTLAKPEPFAPGQVEKYSCDFIIPENDPAFKVFYEEAIAMVTQRFPQKFDGILKMINDTRKLRCYGRGSERLKQADGTIYKGYEGNVYISANSTERPAYYDSDGTELMNVSKLYGGCLVNAMVKPWLQDNKFGKGIRCDLLAVQFAGDGERLGSSRVDTSGMFTAIPGAPSPTATDEGQENTGASTGIQF